MVQRKFEPNYSTPVFIALLGGELSKLVVDELLKAFVPPVAP
jgi:hypothetical protein